ncbi:MAG: Uma2 family endonuclease [Anaerolineae bacterium]
MLAKKLDLYPEYRYSEEEYFALDRVSRVRHELINGQILAMSGASKKHSLITASASSAIITRTRGRGCSVFSSDMRVYVGNSNYVYPDVTVTCGQPQLIDVKHQDTLLNPTVIVEVLSPSTAGYDHDNKFALYRSVETVQAVLFIAQDSASVEVYQRSTDHWILTDVKGLDAVIKLKALEIELPLAEIYEQVANELDDHITP